MKTMFPILLAVCALATARPASAACGAHGDQSSMLVSTAWLAEHGRDPNVVILAAGQKSDYDESHIPGALYLNPASVGTARTEGALTLELLPMPVLKKLFEDLGVNSQSHIVLYTITNGIAATTRVYLTLDAMGLGKQASILDGAFGTWKAERRPVTKEVPSPEAGNLEICPQTDVVTDLAFVKENVKHPGVTIVDARDSVFYTGERLSGKRPGRIPGAVNITFSTLVDESGKFKPKAELETMFRTAGVKPGDKVVSYCHIGQQATMVYFVARYLGFDARMFDGSWEEWSSHSELPADTTPKK